MRRPRGQTLSRAAVRLSETRAFLRVAPHVAPRLDRVLHRLTGGRLMVSRPVHPSLMLFTVGHRSGTRRRVPLLTLPLDDGSYLVVGSNFGRPDHPAWTINLMKQGSASISYRGQRLPVVAQLLDGPERAAVWPLLLATWPAYTAYEVASRRVLRVFRLVPTQSP